MADQENPRFNLRLTPELEALVNQASKKNRRSKNGEILTALEWRYRPKRALTIAEAIEPLLDKLSEEQMAQLVDIIRTMAAPAAKRRR